MNPTRVMCSNVNSSASGSDVKKTLSHTIRVLLRSQEPVVLTKLPCFFPSVCSCTLTVKSHVEDIIFDVTPVWHYCPPASRDGANGRRKHGLFQQSQPMNGSNSSMVVDYPDAGQSLLCTMIGICICLRRNDVQHICCNKEFTSSSQ